jgi:D-alanyl-D-alanine carboxypeptidase/D-alanyl-D-alanine-endopeptidase (penicillin-binding protein 4)
MTKSKEKRIEVPMILTKFRIPASVSFIVIFSLVSSLILILPANADAKRRSSSGRAVRNGKGGGKHIRSTSGRSRRGSRAARVRGERGDRRYAMVRVRGRHGRTVWKRVAVSRPSYSASPAGTPAHSAGVRNFLTGTWSTAQLTPPQTAAPDAEGQPTPSATVTTTPILKTTETSKADTQMPQPGSSALTTSGVVVPPLQDGMPANPLVAAFASSLMARGKSFDNQGLIVMTMDGQVLAEHNADRLFNPASVTKIATSLTALAKLGPNFQFRTNLYTDGALDPQTGILKGSLYVMGSGDPAFFYENAMLIADQLNRSGIREIEGNLVVQGQFYFNFSASREASAKALRAAWNPSGWNSATKSAYYRFLSMRPVDARTAGEPPQPPSIKIDGNVMTDGAVNSASLRLLAVHTSLPLVKVLKGLNDFSNNWMATMVGNLVGGPLAVESFLQKELDFKGEELNIATASGLGSNQISPRGTVKMLRKLVSYLDKNGLRLDDMLPIAGIDEGTLHRRFDDAYRGSVVGKTGTLSGVSALAGIAYTRGKGPLLFVIYNHGGSVPSFRAAQDETVKKIITLYGGPASVRYSAPVAPHVDANSTSQANANK